MTLPMNFHPLVQLELDRDFQWYEQRRAGLGREFLDEVARVLADIVANPARFGFAERDIREGLLHRFPYAIYYRVRPSHIRILAVYHTSRDPAGWQGRR
ncbi:MAG TPA: type II toxin-antitoxin system RelE/ParE family toxin [Gemmataceae bacterium]|nr:type II toxin-antitoxin system RelE/ParE family toxin [Gemmataceae bacterium]